MSFLGSLFDPIGALATGGNNNTFDSIFSPGDNLLGDQGLNLEPQFLSNFNDNWQTPVDNFAGNVVDANMDELRHIGSHFASNPTQLLTGVDPAATKLWNGVLGTKSQPWVDQWGGETNKDMQASANKGINMEDAGYMSTLAHMISSYYAGSELGSLGSAAYASEFPAEGSGAMAGAGGEGGMGSSALNVQAEMAASPGVAGSGSSAAGWDASQIPQWAATSGGAGGAAAGRTFNGAVQGAASALDNNGNPWKTGLRSGLQAGATGGMDYAGTIGLDDPYLKSAVNGGINGGVRAGMQDTDNTGYGALVGALTGLAGKGAQAVGNYFTQPSSGDNGGQTGTTNFGNLATGLGQLYMARQNANGLQRQINNLNDLYAPNSPYAQQMQQTLDRQDAASGRRSQYGTRAVELQAALAGAASRNAPTLANLYAQQRQNRFGQYAGMLATAKNSGLFNGLGSMFQPNPSAPSYQPTMATQPAPQMDTINPGSMQQDYQNLLPGSIDPSQVYGG